MWAIGFQVMLWAMWAMRRQVMLWAMWVMAREVVLWVMWAMWSSKKNRRGSNGASATRCMLYIHTVYFFY